MGNMALSFIANHQQMVYGIVIGAIVSNPGTCALLFFTAFTKIPGVGQWIAAHPEEAKAWADGFDKRIDALIDQYAKANAPVVPPAPAAPSAPPAP